VKLVTADEIEHTMKVLAEEEAKREQKISKRTVGVET